MIEQKLQKFGLSQKEAVVYNALRRLGTSVVSDIAKKSGINRSTAYVLLGALAKRGLVSVRESSGVRIYSPAPAERFIQIAESSLTKWNYLVEVGRELLAEFKNESRVAPSKPTMQLFEGTEGIKTAYDTLLTSKESVFSYSALNAIQETLPDFFMDYRKRQTVKSIRARTIVPDTSLNHKIIENDSENSCEYFLAPPSDYSSDFIITRNKVAFISPAELSALIVENTAFANLQKTMFDAFLTQTKRWNVKSETKEKSKGYRKHPALVKATKRFFSA